MAKTVGPQVALNIYKFLVEHTVEITKDLDVDKWVFYSENPETGDLFDDRIYKKFTQTGEDLGQRMINAFEAGFDEKYANAVIIGSDIYDLNQEDLENAFAELENKDYVIGPAKDGGYYLLGMKRLNDRIFLDKSWGTEYVLKETLADLPLENVKLLDLRNDVDIYEDIKDVNVFQKFLKGD